MSMWAIVENPQARGKDRSKLQPECHDRSRFITIVCNCGYVMHIHETQIPDVIPDAGVIASRCHECGGPLELNAGVLRAAFVEAWT